MRKASAYLFSFLLTTSTFLSTGTAAYAYDLGPGNNVNVNGQRLYFDVPSISMNGRTMVPLRGVFEKLGAEVQWIQDEHRVIVKYRDTTVNLQQNNRKAVVNGVEMQMDVEPIAYNERTMIPLRFISENLGMRVEWIQEAKLATITDPAYYDNLPENSVLGYTTNDYQGDNYSNDSVSKYGQNIDYVATFSYQTDGNGNLKQTGVSQSNTVKYANTNNIKPLVLIHNFLGQTFDKNVAHSVLSDSSKRQNLVNNIFLVMSKEEYAGVNVDIENVAAADRQYYSLLIKELKEKLTPYGYLTTVSIPAKTNDSYGNNSWSGGFDYKEIGKYADRVMIMTYDEHYFGGSAGPIASLPWVKDVMEYATKNISSQKILLGIAGYGYDWSSNGSGAITYRNVQALMDSLNVSSQWDDTAKSPYFIYTKNGVRHEVWYENSDSIASKLELVKQYHLGGIGIWRLGYDNDEFWDTIGANMN